MTVANKLKIQRNWDALHPFCKKQAKKVLAECKKEGLNVAFFEGMRYLERQKTLVAKGRSKTLLSYHRLGLAVDFVFKTEKGNWTWNRPKEDWDKLAEISEKHGFSSGWRWKKFKDGPHIELRFKGIRTSTLYAQLKASKSRKEFYVWIDGLISADSKLSAFRGPPRLVVGNQVVKPPPSSFHFPEKQVETLQEEVSRKMEELHQDGVSFNPLEQPIDNYQGVVALSEEKPNIFKMLVNWILAFFGGKVGH